MNDLETARVTFTCTHCGTVNELTAAYLPVGTLIHCSKCRISIAPLGVLLGKDIQLYDTRELLSA